MMDDDFKQATSELLECGVTLDVFAQAAGVTASTISRARMEGVSYRSPPKEWRRLTRELAATQAKILESQRLRMEALAARMADA
jgi:hypothetical protein